MSKELCNKLILVSTIFAIAPIFGIIFTGMMYGYFENIINQLNQNQCYDDCYVSISNITNQTDCICCNLNNDYYTPDYCIYNLPHNMTSPSSYNSTICTLNQQKCVAAWNKELNGYNKESKSHFISLLFFASLLVIFILGILLCVFFAFYRHATGYNLIVNEYIIKPR